MKIRHDEVMIVNGRMTQIGSSFKQGRTWSRKVAVFACQCGKRTIAEVVNVKRGSVMSCGCATIEKAKTAKKHGHARVKQHSREYRSWCKMHDRCRAKEGTENWRWYGSRGIVVCERWKDFASFLSDMGERPEGHTLDRIDSSKGYAPDNCRWATPLQQSTNSGSARMLTIDGVTQTTAEWARVSGVGYRMLCKRINRGWSPIDAISLPSTKVRK